MFNELLGNLAAICGILTFLASVVTAFRMKKWAWLGSVIIIATSGTIFGVLYFQNQPPPSLVPSGLRVQIDSIKTYNSASVMQSANLNPTITIKSNDEHVKILIKGTVVGVKPTQSNLYAYALIRPQIVEEKWFVHRMERESLRGNGAFEVVAYLGGKGSASAVNNERFEAVVVVSDIDLRDTYPNLREIPAGRPISPIYHLQVER